MNSTSRRRTAAALTLAVAAAVTTAGCSSNGKTTAKPSTSQAATSASASASTTTAATSPTPSPTPTLPSLDTLRAALPTASELGPGLTTSPSNGDSNNTASGCKPLADLLNADPNSTHQVSADYEAGDTGPFVGAELTADTPAALQASYNTAKAAFASCSTITITSGGTKVTFTLTPMQMGGGNTVADRMDGSIQGVQVNGYLALDLLPTALLAFDEMQIGSGSSQLAFALHGKALTKAQQKLGS